MKLQTRILAGFAVVLAIVVGVGVGVVVTQRAQLINQVDRRLTEIVPLDRPAPPTRPGQAPPDRVAADPISDVFLAEVDPTGDVTTFVNGQLNSTTPDLTDFADDPPSTRTFGFATGLDGETRFRTIAEPMPGSGATLVVAIPTTDIDETVDRLTATFALVSLLVAAVLGLLAWWIVRLGLRPISDVAETAHAVADGDRHRRAPELDERTEAGELAASFNVMLDQRDAAEDRLRQFASDASHELRTPLTSIRGYLDLYAAGGFRDDGQLDDVIRRMHDEAARMGVLVEDLLQLARFDEQQPMQVSRVDVGSLVQDVVENARAAHPDRNVGAQLGIDDLTADLDHDRIKQVAVLLVDNALVHAPDAAVHVTATGSDDRITITVTDDGPGLDETQAAKVFTRFFRGDESRARTTGGSGLGLAIAQSIVEAHDGTIELVTAPGAGCTFTVTVPRQV
ncbi:MAG: sensor histidine kinase [Ilumatobacter sp.]